MWKLSVPCFVQNWLGEESPNNQVNNPQAAQTSCRTRSSPTQQRPRDLAGSESCLAKGTCLQRDKIQIQNKPWAAAHQRDGSGLEFSHKVKLKTKEMHIKVYSNKKVSSNIFSCPWTNSLAAEAEGNHTVWTHKRTLHLKAKRTKLWWMWEIRKPDRFHPGLSSGKLATV